MIKVAIIGASGYTGLELVKILHAHPKFEITYIGTSKGGESLTDLHPSLTNIVEFDVKKSNAKEIAKVTDLAFLALPHKASMGFAKDLLNLGVKIVDLSADYRLELDTYEEFYCEHEDKENLPKAVYGLPEMYREEISKTSLVANPGCYPTATLLGLLPFAQYIDENSPIFIDAKSGLSGAGKKVNEITQFVNINENMFAYNPLKHRHSPEIQEKLKLLTCKDFEVNFVPHLIPITRGELVSIYLKLSSDIDANSILKEFYKNEQFIRIRETPVDLKSTAGTNFCDIFVAQNGTSLFISSSIDNLLKGSSSGAVVNANIMCGYEENLGIPIFAYVP
ncbi:N-acetyl-gamma-glutamyl-phosphate reductase [Sulfurospirillum arcachonense]|uniref:N-acetyl-gamma-glutamyl-phosphate reductase n=1 Tax=Sulfurospirillum arcachonense TaxID=57666 RepID=UPI000469190E|nr:N-acetyl-gamma-glutamyl-phosphate reductase [Sulfurospirillum arcachonense]